MKLLVARLSGTAGLEAVLEIAVGARVMLRCNIDTSRGLVNRAVGTVISIKAHHIKVLFDNVPQPYQDEKVKSKFVILKNVYVFRKQFPGICCHYTQVSGSVTGLCHDEVVQWGV